MGFWSTLAGIGKAAAGLIPGAGPLISGGTSLAEGALGARASKKAAEQQAAAAAEAARLAREAGERAAGGVTAAGQGAAAGVESAAARAAAGMRLSAEEANALLRSIYGDSMAWLGDYRTAGTDAVRALAAAMGPEGEFNRRATIEDLELDPGYAFRLAEGQKALERSAAARGGLQSGATLKALTRYAQDVASDEYSKAFNRYQQERAARFGMLSDLATRGQRAVEAGIAAGENYAGRAGGNIMAAGEYGGGLIYRGASDAGRFRFGSAEDAGRFLADAARTAAGTTIGAGDARAAGTMGSANAWAGTIGKIGSIAQEYFRPTTIDTRPLGGGYDLATDINRVIATQRRASTPLPPPSIDRSLRQRSY